MLFRSLEKRVAGRRVVPLKKSLIISFAYLTLNIITMELFALAWYVRYLVVLAVTVLAVKWILPQFLKVVKDFKK